MASTSRFATFKREERFMTDSFVLSVIGIEYDVHKPIRHFIPSPKKQRVVNCTLYTIVRILVRHYVGRSISIYVNRINLRHNCYCCFLVGACF